MFTTRLRALSVFVVLAAAGSGLLLAQSPQAVGTWVGVGSADNPFGNGAHVDLGDGHTLTVGGTGPDSAPTNVVANFDTATNQFAIAGTLLTARTEHTATLLKNGRVLVTGGIAGGLLSTEIELFDPSTGSSTLVAQMPEPRRGHVAALLQNRSVLIAGGYTTGDVVLQSAFIFDPATNAVSPTPGGLNVARASASATSLIDGNVVVVGGTDGTNDLRSAEIFNPFSQSFSIVSTQLSVPVRGHSAVLLPNNGSVLIAGGTSNGAVQAGAELFLPAEFPDPFSWGIGQFAPTAAMNEARSGAIAGPTATEGYAVVTGGGSNGVERYRFATIKTDKDDYPPGQRAVITGSGWQANEEVKLLFQEDPAVHDDYELTVTADGAGNISHDQWAPEEHDLNVRFYLLAVGQNSHRKVQITFTDSRAATAGSVTDNTVVVREAMTGSVTVTTAGGGGNDDWGSTRWTFNDPAGTTGCFDHVPDRTTAGTFTESFSLQAPPTVGTFSVTFTPFQNSDCTGGGNPGGGNGNTPVTVNNIVVSAANTTTTITSHNPDPSNTGQAVTVQVLVSPVAPSTGPINQGTVTINAPDAAPCTTAALVAGGGSCQITFPTSGAKTITATYNGTANYVANTSAGAPHTVNSTNAPPSVAAHFSSVAVDEGTSAANNGTFSDTNAGDTVTISASVGAVSQTGTNNGSWNWSFNTTDGSNQSQTVTITANDGHGGITTTTFGLTVNNVAPTIALTGVASVAEGSPYSLGLGSITDPGTDTVTAYSINWGDGTIEPFSGSPVGQTKTHTYADGPNNRTITVSLTDEDGTDTGGTKPITVDNVTPTVSLTGASNVNEGSAYSLTVGTVVDPGADTVTSYTINWGDGTTETGSGSPAGPRTHTYADGTIIRTITVSLTDDDGTHTGGTKTITVDNVAPIVAVPTFNPVSPVSEGTPVTVSATFSDPGADTQTCNVNFGDGHSGTGVVTAIVGNPTTGDCKATHAYEDNGTFTVAVTVTDKDLGADSESSALVVTNVAPTVAAPTFNPVSPVNEGSSVTVSASFTDPGAADTHTCSVNFGDGPPSAGAVVEPTGATAGTCSVSHTYADDSGASTFNVVVTVTDDDGGAHNNSAALDVNNVAPTATLSNNGPISEGSSATISFSAQADPSSVDTAAGFKYAYSCDSSIPISVTTYAAASTSASTSCGFNDSGSMLVRGRIFDKDNGYTDYDTTVIVNNVAPTATLSNNGPIFEGGSATISFSNQADASSVDVAAGFRYAYSCNGLPISVTTYAAASMSTSTPCAFGDNGSMTVLGRIFDKDNGYTDYSTSVVVNNVVPSNTGNTFFFNPFTGVANASISFSDPGWRDIVTAAWTGLLPGANPTSAGPGSAPGPLTGGFTASNTFTGCFAGAISVVVSDDDGGSFNYVLAPANTLGVYTAAFMAPLKDGARNIVKLGNVIPVKVQVLDCNGIPVLNRTLTVWLVKGVSAEDIAAGENLTEGTSVSSADSGNQMRIADGHYMFNLATKGLQTGTPFTIIVRDTALPAGSQNIATAAIELKK